MSETNLNKKSELPTRKLLITILLSFLLSIPAYFTFNLLENIGMLPAMPRVPEHDTITLILAIIPELSIILAYAGIYYYIACKILGRKYYLTKKLKV